MSKVRDTQGELREDSPGLKYQGKAEILSPAVFPILRLLDYHSETHFVKSLNGSEAEEPNV